MSDGYSVNSLTLEQEIHASDRAAYPLAWGVCTVGHYYFSISRVRGIETPIIRVPQSPGHCCLSGDLGDRGLA